MVSKATFCILFVVQNHEDVVKINKQIRKMSYEERIQSFPYKNW